LAEKSQGILLAVHSSGEDEDQFAAARCIRRREPGVQAGQVRLASVAGVHGANTITHSELNSVHGATSNGTSGGFP